MDERNDDTRAGVTDGMTQGNGATVNVDFGPWDAKNLLCDVNDDGEGLVNLEQGDVVNGKASFLESLGDGDSGSGGEVDGINTRISISWRSDSQIYACGIIADGGNTHR